MNWDPASYVGLSYLFDFFPAKVSPLSCLAPVRTSARAVHLVRHIDRLWSNSEFSDLRVLQPMDDSR